jgi:hypothetical protein
MVWDNLATGFGDEERLDDGRYYYSHNVDCRFEGMQFPSPAIWSVYMPEDAEAGCVRKFVEFRGRLMAFNGRYALFVARSDNASINHDFWTDDPYDHAPITDACAFNGEVIVARGYDKAAWSVSKPDAFRWGRFRWGDGSKWNGEGDHGWSAMTGVYLGYLCPFRDRLWASSGDSAVRACAQAPGIVGNWTNAYVVGDTSYPITSLGDMGELLHIGKHDGLYVLPSDGEAFAVTPEMRSPASTDNCRNMRPWHGYMWVPHQRGFYQYRSLGDSGFTVASATPGMRAGRTGPVRGLVTAVVGDDRWLYASLYTENSNTPGGDTYILAGREARGDEGAYAPIVWHTWLYLPGEHIHTLHLSGLWGGQRLYMATDTGIKFVYLPYATDNPLRDTNCTYQTNSTLYYSRHCWNAPDTRKLFKSVEVLADHLGATQYVDVYYRMDNKVTWHPVGGDDHVSNRAQKSPKHVLSFGPRGMAGRRIEIRLDVTAAGTNNPPVIRSVILRAAERPKTQEVITAVIQCADNIATRQSGTLATTGAKQLAALKELASAARAVELVDVVGYKRYVIVLSPINESESHQRGELSREILATVRMTPFVADADESGHAFRWGRFKWGDGSKWQDAEQ